MECVLKPMFPNPFNLVKSVRPALSLYSQDKQWLRVDTWTSIVWISLQRFRYTLQVHICRTGAEYDFYLFLITYLRQNLNRVNLLYGDGLDNRPTIIFRVRIDGRPLKVEAVMEPVSFAFPCHTEMGCLSLGKKSHADMNKSENGNVSH